MTYQIGDPNHLGVHNDQVARIAALAANGGITVTLPDTAHLGDTGHVDDHNLIVAALAALEAAPPGLAWARVSGGTVTEYTHPEYGLMSVHTFLANGSLTVDTGGYADVWVLGGGSAGVAGTWNGQGGAAVSGLHKLASGTLPVVVGVGGTTGAAPNCYGGHSGLGGIKTNKTNMTTDPSGWGSYGQGVTGGYPGPSSSITGTAVEYANSSAPNPRPNMGDGGTEAGSRSGSAGVVIVAVKKPAP